MLHAPSYPGNNDSQNIAYCTMVMYKYRICSDTLSAKIEQEIRKLLHCISQSHLGDISGRRYLGDFPYRLMEIPQNMRS